jgi:hypothetical protein
MVDGSHRGSVGIMWGCEVVRASQLIASVRRTRLCTSRARGILQTTALAGSRR